MKKQQSNKQLNFSIVIPAFNEKRGIVRVINEIKDSLKDHNKYNYELIIVDDGSKDGMGKVLDKIKDIKLIKHPYNKGYGNSLKTGINNAKYDLIVMLDADGTYAASDIPNLLKYTNKYDLITGARVGKNVKVPLIRKPAKFILTQLAMLLTGVKIPDLNCGLRVIQRENVKRYFHLLPQ